MLMKQKDDMLNPCRGIYNGMALGSLIWVLVFVCWAIGIPLLAILGFGLLLAVAPTAYVLGKKLRAKARR